MTRWRSYIIKNKKTKRKSITSTRKLNQSFWKSWESWADSEASFLMITRWGPSSWPLRRCSKRFQEWCKDSKVFSKMKKTNFKSSSTSSKAYTTLNSQISSSSSFKRVKDLPKQLKVKNQTRRQYSLRNWTICIWPIKRQKNAHEQIKTTIQQVGSQFSYQPSSNEHYVHADSLSSQRKFKYQKKEKNDIKSG